MNHTVRLALDRSVRSYDNDGRLRVSTAVLTRACVSAYLGGEVPGFEQLGLVPSRVYNILRPPEELQRALDGFNGLPILITHAPVSAENHRPDAVIGATGSSARFADLAVSNSLSIWAGEGIAMIESGDARSLSCGYGYTPVVRSGVFQGVAYDLVMTNIQPNHLAIVAEGRVAGAMVGDAKPRKFRRMSMDDTSTDDLDLEQISGKLMTYLAKIISQDDLKNVQTILDGGDPGMPEGAMDRARKARQARTITPHGEAEYSRMFPHANRLA